MKVPRGELRECGSRCKANQRRPFQGSASTPVPSRRRTQFPGARPRVTSTDRLIIQPATSLRLTWDKYAAALVPFARVVNSLLE